MTNEILNLTQRRQAIERGLKQYFNGAMLERVLGHWEQQYSAKPAFVLNRFLSEICTTEELRDCRKDMLRQVLHELSEMEKSELMSGAQQNNGAESADKLVSAELIDAFSQFVGYVLQAVPAKDIADFEQEAQQQIVQSGIALDSQESIGSAEFALAVPLTQYAAIITAVYEVFCEFYGPMRADQVYAQTKLKVKASFPYVDLNQLL
ncbi:MAG: hypothetical protein ACN6NX_00360 [Acinetobacter sp.]